MRLLPLFIIVALASACPPPVDADAVATCTEFIDRIFGHLDECGLDTTQARDDLAQEIDCEKAVEVQGDPLGCAAEFEAVDCAELQGADAVEKVNDTIGACDGEILVVQEN